MTPRYWLIVASRDHVRQGMEGGFSQACHGKRSPLARTKQGDTIIYYSPKAKFGDKISTCRKFTAIGKVIGSEAYNVQTTKDFCPSRIDVEFDRDAKEVAWDAVKNSVSFTSKLRFGFLELTTDEYAFIRNLMCK